MKVSSFFKHWSIRENPFIAEEARQDEIFIRLHDSSVHPDFDKILGDPSRPASAVVFGEKGSGKTALRMQLEQAIKEHNRKHPDSRSLIIAYDELNPVLDRFSRRIKAKNPLDCLQQFKLMDHIDGLLSIAVPDLVDSALAKTSEGHVELGEDASSIIRKMDYSTRNDWRILQALYDRPDQVHERDNLLKKALRYRRISWVNPLRKLTLLLWLIVAAGAAAYAIIFKDQIEPLWMSLLLGCLIITLLASWKTLTDNLHLTRLSRKLSTQLRVLDRKSESFRLSLRRLPPRVLLSATLPVDDLDDPRYAMLERLCRAVKPFGFTNIVVLVDRIDEPTLVNGDTERMKAVVWPLFNNKFLQQTRIAFKMMLPLELRHELFRQNSDFYQEARLDKQNMIDRLVWPGTMLYDLCNSRINACLEEGLEDKPISLTQLFDDTVTRQDIVDALDQMRQPRDAFKLIYQVIQEHCATTTEEEANWTIPKLVLDQVRRSQAERLEGFQRGLRPA